MDGASNSISRNLECAPNDSGSGTEEHIESNIFCEDGLDDDDVSAPIEVLAEFLSAVMSRRYKDALHYCSLILQYEPENTTAKEFYPLIEEKLELEERSKNNNEGENDSCDENDSYSGTDNRKNTSSSLSSNSDNEDDIEHTPELSQDLEKLSI